MQPHNAKRRNVGIFAHVDAGKTTTTEHMLYESGRIRALGSVDSGTAQTDWLDVERERGISVRAAATTFRWRGVSVNLVDTPGHVDFLAEVERSLRVMDGAVLIVSAVEGVQAQTEMIWHALRKLRIPTLIYVNKMDRVGADPERVLADIRKHLSPEAVPAQLPLGAEDAFRGAAELLGSAACGSAGAGRAQAGGGVPPGAASPAEEVSAPGAEGGVQPGAEAASPTEEAGTPRASDGTRPGAGSASPTEEESAPRVGDGVQPGAEEASAPRVGGGVPPGASAPRVDGGTPPGAGAGDGVPLAEARLRLVEAIAECDEALLERYLDGSLPPDCAEEWRAQLARLTRGCALFPVLYGASGRGIGVTALMDAVVDLLPAPSGDPAAGVSGVVFKIERDKTMGRMAFVRLYSGTVRNRDPVLNATSGVIEKVTQVRKIDGRRTDDIGVLEAGDIAAVCGLNQARIGDVLGSPGAVPEEARLAVPLLTVQVQWANEQEYPRVVAALQELADEDPLLDLQWLQDQRELHLKVMGTIQLEILTSVLRTRFGLAVTFGEPSVIYKETPAGPGEGFIAYTMPKPCWAILRFRIEPAPRGSGLQYEACVRAEDLLPQYQNEVARRVPEALHQGLLGWEVVDLKVTLVEGQHHVWHTHPLDFVVATPMGIMNGLANTGTKLLEPMLQFRLTVPEEFGGRVMNDLVLMRAQFEPPALQGDRMTIEGRMPVATSLDYPVKLGSLTKGRGTIATFFDGYDECPPDVRAARPRHGVSPLDQSNYILSVRNALSR